MKEKWDAFMGHAGFPVTLAICLLVAGISGYFLLQAKEEPLPAESQPVTQESAAPVTEITVPKGLEPQPAAETLSPEPVPEKSDPMPEIVLDHTPVIAEAPQLIVSPLKGEILTAFSMDALVYSPTLDDWRTHDGIDIFAKPGTTVQAACAGTVESVTDDVLMGTTVVISHKDGYYTTYANLQSKPAVSAGNSVTAGQIIGAVGTTAAAESAESPHLHFSVVKDGVPIDPHVFLAK